MSLRVASSLGRWPGSVALRSRGDKEEPAARSRDTVPSERDERPPLRNGASPLIGKMAPGENRSKPEVTAMENWIWIVAVAVILFLMFRRGGATG